MAQWILQRLVVNRIAKTGRIEGAPPVKFPEKKISVEGEDMYAGLGFWQRLTRVSAFYLALPPNAYGVVIYPDGTSRNLPGRVYEVPVGLYKLQYVDNRERFDFTAPVTEMTTDGERLTLKVILRYRVIDPVRVLGIARPVETLLEHVEADVAQYIRTHDHADIADSSDEREYSKLFSFFSERHEHRRPLSQAFSIIGVELKDFSGDKEFVDMRRKARMDERKTKIEIELANSQQELGLLKAQHKADNEKNAADHKAEMGKKDAVHEKEKQEILRQVHLYEIELDNKRKHLQMRGDEFSQVIEAISRTFSSGVPLNPNVMKYITDLFAAYKEELDSESQPTSSAEPKQSMPPPSVPPVDGNKVEKLKNTLLDLLNPKK